MRPISASSSSAGGKLFWVSAHRNDRFVGRDLIFQEMSRLLGLSAGHDPSAPRKPLAIVGMGGMGKSQTAAEFAHRQRGSFATIALLRADTPARLALEFSDLAEQLGHQPDSSMESARQYVLEVLDRRGDFLLVFDNVTRADMLADYLPQSVVGKAQAGVQKAGRVVITCRPDACPQGVSVVPLGSWTRHEGVSYIRHRLPGLTTDESAATLAAALEDHPLSIEHACTCMEMAGKSADQFVSEYEDVWAERLTTPGPASREYPRSLELVLRMTFDHVEKSSSSAFNFLKLCCFYSGESIAPDFLRSAAPGMEHAVAQVVADAIRIDRATSVLARAMLVDLTGPKSQHITVHPLVSDVLRRTLDEDHLAKYAAVALRGAATAFRFDSADVKTWRLCENALPHALVAAGHAHRLGVEASNVCKVLGDAGRYLHKRGQFAHAAEVLRQALPASERLYGATHPRISSVLNNLARVLVDLGRLTEAREHFQRALELDERTYGPSDPHVASVINNFATCLLASGDTDLALKQFQWALEIFTAHYGMAHPKTASTRNNVGYVLRKLGRFEEALAHLTTAADICKATYGPQHPSLATVLHNLAEVHRAMGQADVARDLLLQCAEIDRAALGDTHPDIARDLGKLAELMADTGETVAARQNLSMALSITEDHYGDDHPRARRLRQKLSELSTRALSPNRPQDNQPPAPPPNLPA